MMDKERFGKIAYDAYVGHTGGVSLVSGVKLPSWDKLPQSIRDAWGAASEAVIKAASPREYNDVSTILWDNCEDRF